ncbi:hypothetical protein FSP39_010777 [Pinctada imbricata]|uniref:Protein SSUH2 homolog n=1 Tax=Pinctada imbricata TaxID=66713 RepID=A0AA89C605_PINIB|nr:hypothetical protein FSP39_010777 [Pinctada imbricata]
MEHQKHHKNIKHKRPHIKQLDQLANSADLKRPSATAGRARQAGSSYGGQYPPSQGYPGPQQPGYSGAPPPAGGYPGGAPQTGGYPGGPPQSGYQGGAPPAGAYGGAPQTGGYPGGPTPAGGYPGGPPPAGGYQGGAPPGGGGQPDPKVPQYSGEMPGEDVIEDPNAPTSSQTASAPPLEKMDTIAGYNNVGIDTSGFLPPPSYDDAMKQGPPPERQNIQNVPSIDEKEAREALLSYVAENCCYGKGAAEDLKYLDLQSSSAFHYTLETFGEGRMTAWAYEPYTGQPIDGPQNGVAPAPWDIHAQPASLFTNSKQHFEVPHTASVKPCHTCFAMGYVRCDRCLGRGRVRCHSCHGSGHVSRYRDGHHHHESCHWCHGSGRRQCSGCWGRGMVSCPTCNTYRSLKCYIKLTVTWTNHIKDHIVERTPLPDHLIRNVSGQTAFEETFPRVYPINHFPDREINEASNRIIATEQFPNEKLLMQRHRVRIVPVTQCLYKWKDKELDYFVYGFEHKVYAPTYPQTCCCGCILL